jgi:small nuclear ribonucleoprotein (snRNP)-like protein
VQGTLGEADKYMNLFLTGVNIRKLDGTSMDLEATHVKGSSLRYVRLDPRIKDPLPGP